MNRKRTIFSLLRNLAWMTVGVFGTILALLILSPTSLFPDDYRTEPTNIEWVTKVGSIEFENVTSEFLIAFIDTLNQHDIVADWQETIDDTSTLQYDLLLLELLRMNMIEEINQGNVFLPKEAGVFLGNAYRKSMHATVAAALQ
jgi:hypothetical protein